MHFLCLNIASAPSHSCHAYLNDVGPIVLDVEVHVSEQVRPHILAAGHRLRLAHETPDGQVIQVQLHSTGRNPRAHLQALQYRSRQETSTQLYR